MSWPTVKLGDCVNILSGFAFDSEQFSKDEGIKLIRIRDVTRGFSDTSYIGQFDKKYLVKQGDILIGMDGEFNRAKWASEDALLNQRVCKISTNENILNKEYLFHLLPIELKKIEEVTPFVTVKHLSVKGIKDIQISLPPLSEQKRIAAILDKAEHVKRKRELAIEKLDRLTESVFYEMFGNPSNENRWGVKKIGECCTVKGGKRLQKGEEYSSVPTKYRYIRVKNLKKGYVQEENLLYLKDETYKKISNYIVNDGDVIISIAGSIGITAPVTQSLNGVNLTENAAKITPLTPNTINNNFLSALLQTKHMQERISANVGQVTIGKLALFRIENLEIQLPPFSLQVQFSNNLIKIEKARMAITNSLNKTLELTKAIQSQVFSGNYSQ